MSDQGKTAWRTRRLVSLEIVGLLVACGPAPGPSTSSYSGATMGTTWSATVVTDAPPSTSERDAVQDLLEETLASIDASMSTWKEASDLSRFNRAEVGAPFAVDPGLVEVVAIALEVHAASGGAFDPTVGPLVELYGFGPEPMTSMPDEDAIARCLEAVGLRAHIDLDGEAGTLTRLHSAVELDLSAIAKGWAVDRAAAALAARGHVDVLVEVGGEVVALGERADGGPWRLAIEDPGTFDPDGPRVPPVRVLLSGAALATSGDYRNWRALPEGGRISHTIDPRTGQPTTTPIASASVIAPTCVEADALATALMVLGESGLPLIEVRPDTHALLQIREGGALRFVRTTGWDAHSPRVNSDEGSSR